MHFSGEMWMDPETKGKTLPGLVYARESGQFNYVSQGCEKSSLLSLIGKLT